MLSFSMGSIIQKSDGDLISIENIKDANLIIQLVQLMNGNLKDLFLLDKGDQIISFKSNNQEEKIRYVKTKSIDKLIYLKLKNGLFVILPEEFKIISTSNARIVHKKVSQLKKGDFIATPIEYNTTSRKTKFDAWNLDDFLFISGIKNWYSEKLKKLMKSKKLLIKDIAQDLKVPYWKVRRNALSKESINYGLIKKFIKKYLKKEELYKVISLSKGLKNEKSAGKYAKIPFSYEEELAYLDAILVGEGHIVKNEKQAILEFSDIEFTENLKRLIEKVHSYKQKGSRINLPGFLAYFYSRFLRVPKGNKSKIVSFPPLALQSNNDVLLGALRGIIDGEGNINTNKQNVNISITTSSFRLVLGTVSALLRLGISCSIRKSIKDSTWTICINRGCMEKFAKEIRFLRCPKKNEALVNTSIIKAKERIIIPNVGNHIENIRRKANLSSSQLAKEVGLTNTRPMEDSGNFSLESLSKINKILKDRMIDALIKKDLKWNKIVDIKRIKMRTKFPFPKTEGFFLLNHIFVRS